jgi:hypothetical protein
VIVRALDADPAIFPGDDEVDGSVDVGFGSDGASTGFVSTTGDGERTAATIACLLASDPTVCRGKDEAVVIARLGKEGASMAFDSTASGGTFSFGVDGESKSLVDNAFVFGASTNLASAAGGGAFSFGTDDSNCSAGNAKCPAGAEGDPSSLTFLTFIAFPVGKLSASTSMGTVCWSADLVACSVVICSLSSTSSCSQSLSGIAGNVAPLFA